MDSRQQDEQEEQAAVSSDHLLKFMSFRHCGMDIAVPLENVLEVMPTSNTTPIPNAKSYMRGIMNLRGRIVTVIDLNPKLGIRDKMRIDSENVIVMMHAEDVTMGVVVEEITNVVSAYESQIYSIDEFDADVRANHVNEIIRIDDGMILILDLESFFELRKVRTRRSA